MSAPASAEFDDAAPGGPSAFARWALNLPVPVDGDLPGGLWCSECAIRSNHTGEAHRRAEAEAPDES